jgi:nitrite reductase/ring-hydroxylating ferredoxin subunit
VSQPACRSDDLPPGALMAAEASDGTPVVLCNIGGTFYALEDKCTHGASALSDGQLLGCEIECELHKGRFDVTSGKATRRPAKKPVATYECTVRDGAVYVTSAA